LIATIGLLLVISALHSAHAAEDNTNFPAEITGKDGAPMALVPAGEFLMGNSTAVHYGGARRNEKPQQPVYLDAYYIDKYEVSNTLYFAYVEANGGGSLEPAYLPTNAFRVNLSIHGNRPVTSIRWSSAKGYCEWAGKRLPTEAEWEKAARGRDGRMHPWGDAEPTNELAHFGVRPQEWQGPSSLAPVDSHPQGASPYGVHHMVGNVFEWVNDIYLDEYYQEMPLRNPQGPPKGTMNKHGKKLSSYGIRGGSAKSVPAQLTTTFRAGWSHIYNAPYAGFRCAQNVGDAEPTRNYEGTEE